MVRKESDFQEFGSNEGPFGDEMDINDCLPRGSKDILDYGNRLRPGPWANRREKRLLVDSVGMWWVKGWVGA